MNENRVEHGFNPVTDFLIEVGAIKIIKKKVKIIEPKRICGNCKHYQECIGDGEGFDTIHPDNEDCGEWEPEE